MARGEGPGWHRESRRHSEVQKDRRPTHAKANGATVQTDYVRTEIDKRIQKLEQDQKVIVEAFDHYPEGDLQTHDYDEQYKGMDFGEWFDLDNQIQGELKELRQLRDNKGFEPDSLNKRLKEIQRQGNKLQRQADDDLSLEDMRDHLGSIEENSGQATAIQYVQKLLRGNRL